MLLGNHGAIAVGADLDVAMHRARELETLARIYYLAISVGRPAILSDEEVGRIVERFKDYGAAAENAQGARAAEETRAARQSQDGGGQARRQEEDGEQEAARRKDQVTNASPQSGGPATVIVALGVNPTADSRSPR